MTDIESTVAAALRADTDRPVGADGLHDRAVARAHTIRTRRRVFGVAAGAGLAVAMTAGMITMYGLVRGGASGSAPGATDALVPPPPATAVMPPDGPTTLAPAAGVPGAAAAPATVGQDPSLIHFDLKLSGLGGGASKWISAPGYEGVTITDAKNSRILTEVLLGRDPGRLDEVALTPGLFGSPDRRPVADAPITTSVNGRPATLTRLVDGDSSSWVLAWQPVDGLHARVQVFRAEQSNAVRAAGALRLTATQRCVAPMRVEAPPANAELTSCMTAVRHRPIPVRGVWMHSELTYRTSAGRDVSVWAEEDLPRAGLDTSQFVPNTTVNGRPAQWRTANPRGLWLLGFDPAGELFIAGASRAESIRVAAGVSIVGDLADPRTWPVIPVG
jgi:hypothetical protein